MEKLNGKYLSALREIDNTINSTVNFQRISTLIVEKTTSFLGVKGISLSILEKGNGELKSTASFGLSGNYLSKTSHLTGKSIIDTLERRTLLISDAATDPCTQYPESAKQEGIGTVLSSPLSVNGNMVGVLRIYYPEGYELTKEIVTFVEMLCQKIALAIEKAFQYELVEDKHEIIMPDIWKWFRIKSYSRDIEVRGFNPPPPLCL